MLFVDTRWNGNHGIGRFAREVSTRLPTDFESLRGGVKPSSPLDVVLPSRMVLKPEDVVYSPGYNCGLTRASQLLTIHDLIHLDDLGQSSQAKNFYYERLIKPVIKRAGLAFTVSESSRSRAAEWLNDDAVEIRVVGNGSSDAFHPDGDSIPRPQPTFLYVGNLRTHKNVEVLFRALAQRPEYRLDLVTPNADEARQLAQKFGVLHQVTSFSGVEDRELASLYRGAVATLMPSLFEGFGFPALESFLCGTPVLYWTGCASVAEISNGSGIAIQDASSSEEWAHAMDRSIAESTQLLRVPASAWRERYDWNTVARNVDTALAEYRH